MSGDGCQQKIVSGSNNTNTCGPPKYSKINSLQAAEIKSALASFKGLKIRVVAANPTLDSYKFAKELTDLLNTIPDTYAAVDSGMQASDPPLPPGLSYAIGPDSVHAAGALGAALHRSGITKDDPPTVYLAPKGDQFLIWVAPLQ
jgi:hypothetical protein